MGQLAGKACGSMAGGVGEVGVDVTATDDASSGLLEAGQVVGRVGDALRVTINPKDSCGLPRTVTDEQWEVTMQSQIGLVHIGPRDVVPAADGTLEVSFLAQVAGTYHLRARLADGGTAAAGFNALFTVLPAE